MLKFFDGVGGPSRREFLTVGALGLGGLSLPGLLAARASAAEGKRLVTGRSVIFLFQHGGPSQHETLDPKTEAPEAVRSVVGVTRTSVPGTLFGAGLPNLARHAHRLAVVRSFQTGTGNHDIKPVVSRETLNANMGSLYARVVGNTRPTGMPSNAALFPNCVDPKGPGALDRFGKFTSTGSLGASFAPFVPGGAGQLQANMKLNLPRERLEDRRKLLAQIDRLRREMDVSGGLETIDRFQQQAVDVILGGVADAFDLSKEDPKTVARYDTAALTRPDAWKKWNNRNRYTANAHSLGKLLLLARRLCEAGCGFVTISPDFVWDFHADKNNVGVKDGMDFVGKPFDHAVSAFIEDLEARGLSDRILLVCTGEMGRTPKVNNRGGRDHWGKLTPLMLYGGGLTHGQLIGHSNRDGGEPAGTPLTSADLVSTIMHALFDVGQVRLEPSIPADVARVVTGGKPIPGIF
jgi:uncharacterized protein (DUF1501 family)